MISRDCSEKLMPSVPMEMPSLQRDNQTRSVMLQFQSEAVLMLMMATAMPTLQQPIQDQGKCK